MTERYHGWAKFSREDTWLVAIGANRNKLPVYRSTGGPLVKTRLHWPMDVAKFPAGTFSEVSELMKIDLGEIQARWGEVPDSLD